MIESVSAVTLATHNMARAVAFYRMLGFEIIHGGDDARLQAFGLEPAFSISSHNPRSESGLGGDVSSFTIPTSTTSMRA